MATRDRKSGSFQRRQLSSASFFPTSFTKSILRFYHPKKLPPHINPKTISYNTSRIFLNASSKQTFLFSQSRKPSQPFLNSPPRNQPIKLSPKFLFPKIPNSSHLRTTIPPESSQTTRKPTRRQGRAASFYKSINPGSRARPIGVEPARRQVPRHSWLARVVYSRKKVTGPQGREVDARRVGQKEGVAVAEGGGGGGGDRSTGRGEPVYAGV